MERCRPLKFKLLLHFNQFVGQIKFALAKQHEAPIFFTCLVFVPVKNIVKFAPAQRKVTFALITKIIERYFA